MSAENPRVAILASGDRESGKGGSTANKVARDVLQGKARFTIGVVICNNPEGTVAVYDLFDKINSEFDLTGDNKIDVVTINSVKYPKGKQERGQTLEESEAICKLLEERGIDFVSMLGYMKVLNGQLVEEWGWKPEYGTQDSLHNGIYHPSARILNNHPGILPFTANTHGSDTHERSVQLYRDGVITHTAMSYHLGAAAVDAGAMVREFPIRIHPQDTAQTLGTRVQQKEKAESASVIDMHLALRAQHLMSNGEQSVAS